MNDLTDAIQSAVNATWNAFGRKWWTDLDADDAKQTAFMACWKVRDRYDPERSAPTTFFSLIARQTITRLRDQELAARCQSLSVEAFEDGPDYANLIEAQPPESPLPELNEDTARLREAMETTLTKPEREVMEGILEGATVGDLALKRGTSHQAVSKQRSNALSKLRNALSKRP